MCAGLIPNAKQLRYTLPPHHPALPFLFFFFFFGGWGVGGGVGGHKAAVASHIFSINGLLLPKDLIFFT